MLQIFAINTLIQDLFVISTQSFKISVKDSKLTNLDMFGILIIAHNGISIP